MSEDVLSVANSLGVWLTAAPVAILTVIQDYLYTSKFTRLQI